LFCSAIHYIKQCVEATTSCLITPDEKKDVLGFIKKRLWQTLNSQRKLFILPIAGIRAHPHLA